MAPSWLGFLGGVVFGVIDGATQKFGELRVRTGCMPLRR